MSLKYYMSKKPEFNKDFIQGQIASLEKQYQDSIQEMEQIKSKISAINGALQFARANKELFFPETTVLPPLSAVGETTT